MDNIFSTVSSSIYSFISPTLSLADSVCRSNGEVVPCPAAIGAIAMIAPALFLVVLVVLIVLVVSQWKVFEKAGQPGWASLVPVYNIIVLLDIVKKPRWWVILALIPFANMVIGFILAYELSKAFGKNIGFTIGLILIPFVFFPILAFGDSKYVFGIQQSPV